MQLCAGIAKAWLFVWASSGPMCLLQAGFHNVLHWTDADEGDKGTGVLVLHVALKIAIAPRTT
jgi:hypothetical protein